MNGPLQTTSASFVCQSWWCRRSVAWRGTLPRRVLKSIFWNERVIAVILSYQCCFDAYYYILFTTLRFFVKVDFCWHYIHGSDNSSVHINFYGYKLASIKARFISLLLFFKFDLNIIDWKIPLKIAVRFPIDRSKLLRISKFCYKTYCILTFTLYARPPNFTKWSKNPTKI